MTKTSENKSQPSSPPIDSLSVVIPVCFLVGIGLGVLGVPTLLSVGVGAIVGYIIHNMCQPKSQEATCPLEKNMNTNNESSSVVPYITDSQTVQCPFCAEEVQQAAIKCKHCGSQLNARDATNPSELTIENEAEEDKVEYEENPAMFRNHPFYFVFCLALCFVGIGFIMFIYWWSKKKSYKLTVSRYKTSLTTGFFSKKTSEVFHTDIKNIVVEQSILQRILNTGTIKVSSSGQDDFEIAIHGMPRPYDIKGIIDLHRTPNRQKPNQSS